MYSEETSPFISCIEPVFRLYELCLKTTGVYPQKEQFIINNKRERTIEIEIRFKAGNIVGAKTDDEHSAMVSFAESLTRSVNPSDQDELKTIVSAMQR